MGILFTESVIEKCADTTSAGPLSDEERASAPGRLATRLREVGGVPILGVSGEVDLATVDVLSASLDRAVRAATGVSGRVVVDLRGVVFMDAVGVGALVEGRSRLNGVGVELRVVAREGGQVRRLLVLLGLYRELGVYGSLASAADLPAGTSPGRAPG